MYLWHRYLPLLTVTAMFSTCLVRGDDKQLAQPVPAEIDRLVKQLGSDDFVEREAATKTLMQLGSSALDLLRKAETGSKDEEVRARLARVIEAMEPPLDCKLLRRCEPPTETGWRIGCEALSPDGRRALSGGVYGTIRLWDMETGKVVRTFKAHKNWTYSVAFSRDGKRALSCGGDPTIRLWDLETGKELRRIEGRPPISFCSVAFSPDGKQILAGSDDHSVRLWDLKSGKEVFRLEGHAEVVSSVAFSPDGKRAISGSEDGTVRLWDLERGKEVRCLGDKSIGIKRVHSVAFSPDGRRALSGGDNLGTRRTRLWDLDTGKELRCFTDHSSAPSSVAFSPDGRWLLSGSDDGAICLRDGRTYRELYRIKGFGGSDIAFSADGRLMLFRNTDNALELWQLFCARSAKK